MTEPVSTALLSFERTTSLLEPLREPQRYERIAERIAGDIRAGVLVPGGRLPGERALARRLGVGRASVREALAALQNAGVLETRPGSGSFVAAGALDRIGADEDGDGQGLLMLPHDASPSALLETRLLLEPGIARLAARTARRDDEVERLLETMDRAARERDRAAWNETDRCFHRRLAVLTGNPVLISLAAHVAALMDQPLWQRLRDESIDRPGRAAVHAAEHRLIQEAIVDGDADAAAFHATAHLERVRRNMTLDQE